MAVINFPIENVSSVDFNLRLVRRQNINVSLSLKTQVTDLSQARWEVSTTLTPFETHNADGSVKVSIDEAGSLLAVFIQGLDGPKNTTRLPFFGPKLQNNIVLGDASVSDGILRHAIAPGSSSDRNKIGQYAFSSKSMRIFQVLEISSDSVALIPDVPISGETLSSPSFMVVRQSGQSPFIQYTWNNSYQPAIIIFEEVVS